MEALIAIGIILLLLIIVVLGSRKRIYTVYRKYLKVKNTAGIDGKQLAVFLKDKLDLDYLSFARTKTDLGDAYYPKQKTLLMSDSVADTDSLASLTIVAHEMGHALQHKTNNELFHLTYILSKITRFTNKFVLPLLIAGGVMIFFPVTYAYGMTCLITGFVLFLCHIILKLSTIPLEYDASKRALNTLRDYKILSPHEMKGAKKLLNTAAQTYIASLFDGIIIPTKRLTAIFSRKGRK